MISDIDLAYLAGLIDGEGCFHCSFSRRKNGCLDRRMYLSVTNIDRATLLSLRDQHGIGTIQKAGSGSSRPDKWRQCYCWTISYGQSKGLIRSILPYLRIKRMQAELFLSIAELASKARYGIGRKGRHCDSMVQQMDMMVRLKLLKRA